MMKLPVLAWLLALLALVPACSPQGGAPHSAPAAAAPAEPPPLDVATATADERLMPRYLRITGELKGYKEAKVAADATGKVVEAPVERGTVVKKGDVLVRLDNRGAALSLLEAEASVASAGLKTAWQKSELARNEPLAKTKAVSDMDFQRFKLELSSSEASLAAAEARRDLSRKAVEDAVIRAPFDGTVAERLVEMGEYVGNNTQVAALVAIDRLKLVLNVPETSLGKLKLGQKVLFAVPAYPGETFEGTVKFMGAAVRESARDLIVEAEVANQEGRLKPGMFAEGRLVLAEEQGVTVPVDALRSEGPVRKLFVVESEHITERLVETGETKDGVVEIRRGVKKGESVVVTPSPEAADGMRVKLTAQL